VVSPFIIKYLKFTVLQWLCLSYINAKVIFEIAMFAIVSLVLSCMSDICNVWYWPCLIVCNIGHIFSCSQWPCGVCHVPACLTHVLCVWQDGEVVYVDWMPQKDQDSGKIQSESPSITIFIQSASYSKSIHPCTIWITKDLTTNNVMCFIVSNCLGVKFCYLLFR